MQDAFYNLNCFLLQVEKAPTVLKAGATKEEAENWKKVIESGEGGFMCTPTVHLLAPSFV